MTILIYLFQKNLAWIYFEFRRRAQTTLCRDDRYTRSIFDLVTFDFQILQINIQFLNRKVFTRVKYYISNLLSINSSMLLIARYNL